MKTILPHQQIVIKTIIEENNFNKFLLFHSTGSGKTTTALLTAFDLDCDIIILTPKSTTSEWIKRTTIVKSYFNSIPLAYNGTVIVSSYKYFVTNPAALDKLKSNKTILIVDEAHNLRDPLKNQRHFNDVLYNHYMTIIPQEARDYIRNEFDKNKNITSSDKWILLLNELRRVDPTFKLHEDMKYYKKNKSTWFIYLATLMAHKTIFLTATPIVNDYPNDIKNLSFMMYGTSNFKDVPIQTVRKTILYYNMKKDPKYEDKFPKDDYEDVLIKDPNYNIKSGIDDVDYSKYGFLIAANIISRLSISALMEYIGPKVMQMMNILKDKLPTKVFVYSHWVEHGVKRVQDILTKSYPNAEISVITGKTTPQNVTKILDRYNNIDTDDITKILIVSSVGAEGLNLYGVRHVFLLEPPWTNAQYMQIVSRAIRYGSHDHLPENERTVRIYRLILVGTFDKLILDDYMTNKKRYEDEFLDYVTT